MDDLISIMKAVSVSSILITLSLYLINQFIGYARSIFFIDWLLLIVMIGGFRFSIRLSKEIRHINNRNGKRALIVGAGEAGESILREMIRNRALNYNPIGLVDDDPSKIGSKVHGIKVLGDRTKIPILVSRHGVEEIIICMPSANSSQIKIIIDECIKTKAKFKTLPSLLEIINAQASVNQIWVFSVEDLLGRDPVKIDLNSIKEEISKKRVLVTGAGGYIGSELCRQIAKFEPEELLLFEHAENSLFYLDRGLKEGFPNLRIIPLLADVTNNERTNRILSEYRPAIIFHAAAHKHVPLNEINPIEVIRNNVIGTKYIVDAAIDNGVDKFVFISTDKAVKPINFMGMSKRIAEQYISAISQNSSVRFLSVRFGNVIGSTGSIFRIFKEQISKGGPVTVTDSKASRYFMTIPEAVQLVLQAAHLGNGGEIFVLEMGEPINIYELAKTIISLSGLDPDRDVKIVFTGLRPGEKLHEELFDNSNEELISTQHDKIKLIKQNGLIDTSMLLNHVSQLQKTLSLLDEDGLANKIHEMIPECGNKG